MASFDNAIANNVFDSMLPPFGGHSNLGPVWDDGQKMFIFDDHTSASGNHYYRGVRFCDRLAIVEKVGLYHTWTYIDSIEVYVFEGNKVRLVQKRDYTKQFRDNDFVRAESEQMVRSYLSGMVKMQGARVQEAQVEAHAKQLVSDCYKSFLDDNYNERLLEVVSVVQKK